MKYISIYICWQGLIKKDAFDNLKKNIKIVNISSGISQLKLTSRILNKWQQEAIILCSSLILVKYLLLGVTRFPQVISSFHIPALILITDIITKLSTSWIQAKLNIFNVKCFSCYHRTDNLVEKLVRNIHPCASIQFRVWVSLFEINEVFVLQSQNIWSNINLLDCWIAKCIYHL